MLLTDIFYGVDVITVTIDGDLIIELYTSWNGECTVERYINVATCDKSCDESCDTR